jgi:aldehyde dehydrogenase (NAD+)
MTTTPKQRLSFPLTEGKLFINGQWRAAQDGQTRPIINPATEEEITRVAEASASDVEEAIAAASQAFTSDHWRKMDIYARAQLLMRIADLLEQHADEVAFLESINVGKPIAFMRSIEVQWAIEIFRYYSGVAMQLGGRSIHGATPTLNYTLREPLGVVGAITPFNFPLILAVTKIAPVLAAGNTIVHKPASLTPLSALK